LKAYCQWREDMLLSNPCTGSDVEFSEHLKCCPIATPITMHKLASIGSTIRTSHEGGSVNHGVRLDYERDV
jgi:hypothetical protein